MSWLTSMRESGRGIGLESASNKSLEEVSLPSRASQKWQKAAALARRGHQVKTVRHRRRFESDVNEKVFFTD
jgi:hypothetical protein